MRDRTTNATVFHSTMNRYWMFGDKLRSATHELMMNFRVDVVIAGLSVLPLLSVMRRRFEAELAGEASPIDRRYLDMRSLCGAEFRRRGLWPYRAYLNRDGRPEVTVGLNVNPKFKEAR